VQGGNQPLESGLLVGHCTSQPANLERAALTVPWEDPSMS